MPQVLPAPLTSGEFATLKVIGIGPIPRAVPTQIQAQLIKLGYVKDVMGTLSITDDGMRRLAIGK